MATCACGQVLQLDLAEAEKAGTVAAQARLHSELDSADGYTADAAARKIAR